MLVNAWSGAPNSTGVTVRAKVGIVAELDGTSGSHITTPDTAALRITGDVSLRAWVTPDDFDASAYIVSRYDTVGDDRSYALRTLTGRTFEILWSDDGINIFQESSSQFDLPAEGIALRADLDVDNGASGHDIRFFTAPTITGPWTQLGTTVTNSGATSINAGSADLYIGARNDDTDRFVGKVHAAEVHGASRVASADFWRRHVGETSFTGDEGLTWTLNGSATLTGDTGRTVRLAVQDDPELPSPTFVASDQPSSQGIVTLEAAGLDPDTFYWWQIEDDGGVLDTSLTGRFRTFPAPGTAASFRVAIASCTGGNPTVSGVGDVLAESRLSNHHVFDTIRSLDPTPVLFIDMGDRHYYDLGSDNHGITGGASLANYRRAHHDVLLQPERQALHRDIPVDYAWDDHDYGPNNSDGTHPGKANAQQVHREVVPHYDLPSTSGIFHQVPIGRVLFMVADPRSDRSPNDDPDDSSKTMLGAEQKQWMRDVLNTSDAEVLVWVAVGQWMGLGSDTWASFTVERDEVVNLFRDTGWIDRMCVVGGDVHALAIDTGGNSPGGMPVFQFAAMDSSGGSPQTHYDTGDTSPGNNRYGTIDVEDDGQQVSVTGTGWIGTSLWRSHTFTVGETSEPAPPTESPERISVAEIRSEVTWLGCDLGTGRIIQELPDITGAVSRVIGNYTRASLRLPIPTGGPGSLPISAIEQATAPREALIVAVVNDVPAWAGIPLQRRGGSDATLQLGCVSVESYLRHRFVRDHEWTQQDEAAVIAAGLFADAGEIAGVGNGIGLIVDAPPTGRLRDRSYQASDHKTVYRALQELMGVIDGPEWTIDIDWTDETHTAVRLIARVRPRIGTAAEMPSAVFESTGGASADYVYDEDHSGDRAGNYVIAYSSGEGEDQPVSAPAVDEEALAGGVPIWERHYQPSSSIIEVSTLDNHANAELERIRLGALSFDISARWDRYPRYGVDWELGDDIAWRLTGHRHPGGVSGQGRVVGWGLDTSTGLISPILQEA